MIDDALGRRVQYETDGIDLADTDPDPYRQFGLWFEQAALDIVEANAMVLSTIGDDGPSGRAVLLRDIVDGRFVFFTNRASRKGRDIAADPRVSLLFPWFPLHRQVRVDGLATTVSDDISDRYFESRPAASRAGAIASPQSDVIPSREWLERAVASVIEGADLRRPEHWGGYAVEPVRFEFWQGRPGRLHDRIRYERSDSGWNRDRLAP
ncbi:MAG TPA: pyridoxamine 5'-phosphate oxidase [Acidimicrobiia bacterium]|nr:pyridoxamine 5'-phosphate oxidase [Acidimicrobiia bacterium]